MRDTLKKRVPNVFSEFSRVYFEITNQSHLFRNKEQDYLNMLNVSLCIQYRGNISSRFSSNSEALQNTGKVCYIFVTDSKECVSSAK